MPAPFLPQAVANEFLERSGRDSQLLTPMQLLKLVYITHGWHLAVTKVPLFEEPVQAWKYGPVVPSLFHEFKVYGGKPILRMAHYAGQWPSEVNPEEPELVVSSPFLPSDGSDALQVLDWVWKVYGGKAAWELSEMTHKDGTPWSKAVAQMRAQHPGRGWVPDYVIPNPDIRQHYLDLWNSTRAPSVA